MDKYKEYLNDKTVAIVGPASSIIGSSYGEEIDSFDIVARMKYFDYKECDDMGSRCDIIFLSPYSYIKTKHFFDFKYLFDSGVKYLLSTWVKEKKPTKTLINDVGDCGLQVLCIDANIRNEFRHINKEYPYSGIISILHLLDSPIKKLKVFGFDFYSTQYVKGYISNSCYNGKIVNGIPDIQFGSIHNNIKQFNFFKNHILKDKRVFVDGYLGDICSKY